MKKFKFKKIVASIMAFTLVISANVSTNADLVSVLIPVNPISASAAASLVSGSWKYTIYNGEAQIEGYTGTATYITTPKTLGGYPVKEISSLAFYNNTTLQCVRISEGVTTINGTCFTACTNLNTVYLPSTLEKIGYKAFCDTGIGDIVIPASVTEINDNVFEGCKNLKTVTIKSQSELSLCKRVFSQCINLNNINVDLNKVNMHEEIFKDCVNLYSINNQQLVFAQSKGKLVLNDKYIKYIKNIENNKYINPYVLQEAKRVVNEVTTTSMSDYQKAKVLHDWICKKVDYDHENMKATKNHVDSSIFLNDKTVCEGYACGYSLLLQAAEVEACVVSSSSHAWNIVKLGGHYFHIDVCHDDETGNDFDLSHYALSDTAIKKECAKEGYHSKWYITNHSDLHNYPLSNKPLCQYSIGDINKDGKVDNLDQSYIINYLVYNAECKISASDEVLADVNFDGKIDICDATSIHFFKD